MKRKRGSKNNRGLARGKMYLASRLGWLSGVPLRITAEGIQWLAVPRFGDRTPHELMITGDALARTSRTWTKLVHRFPVALPQLVEDVAWWKAAVPELLRQLGQTIHHGVPLPAARWDGSAVADQAAALIQATPALQPAVNGLSWALHLYPNEQPAALRWVEANQTAVQTILTQLPDTGLGMVLSLWYLTAQNGEPQTQSVMTFLGESLLYERPLDHAFSLKPCEKRLDSYLDKGQMSHGLVEIPKPNILQSFQKFVHWLMGQNQMTRKRALALWADLWPHDYLATWRDWWASLELFVQGLRRVTGRPLTAETKPEAEALEAQLGALQRGMPAPLHSLVIFACIQEMAGEPKLYQQVQSTLRLIPRQLDKQLPRPNFLWHWLNLYNRYGRVTVHYLVDFQTYLRSPLELTHLLGPWEEIWNQAKPRRYWGLDFDLLSETPEQAVWEMTFDVIVQATAALDEPLTDKDAQNIASFVRLTREAELALTYFEECVAAEMRDMYVYDEAMRCAHTLNDPHDSQFGQLLKIIDEADDWLVSQRVMEAVSALEAAGWLNIGRVLALDGELSGLQRAGQLYKMLSAQLNSDVPPPSPFPIGKEPVWLGRYPNPFHPALRLLHTVSPTAEAAAQRILGKNYPDPVRLQQEIVNLQTQLAAEPEQPYLIKRLASLERRLNQPATVSAVRVGRLEEKLQLAVQRAALKLWHAQLSAALRQHLATLLKIEDPPAWLSEPAQLTILAPMLQLPFPFKQLGLRLLNVRTGASSWNLQDDPVNQAFVRKMERYGIYMEAWLNPPPSQEMVGANGRTVIVSFETDPLEIFHMGGHFNTCLSPGAFNFFSVFANAADINKHVVYARTSEGQVIGRCLLALTDQGGLLTFEPYCHDSKLRFDKMMGEVANKLAKQMKTLPVIKGDVSPLVAPDWYDDGPRDLCGRFTFLAENSAFRTSLPKLTPEQFMVQLQQGFDPLPLNGLTLTLTLSLWELNQSPHLIVPLLQHVEAHKNISDSLLLFAAKLAHEAGEIEAANSLVKDRAVPYLHRLYREQSWLDLSLVRLLAELDPSAALRLLRQTRPPGVRRDEDELRERREVLALAHENLGRAVRAQRLRSKSRARN